MAIKLRLVVFLLFAAAAADVAAADSGQSMFTFSGFGSLGLSHSSESRGDYVQDSGIPKGPGLSENWSTANDSRIAVHLAADFTPKVSAVLQVISEYHIGNTFQPEVEWANVKYAFTPDIYIRIGRTELPTFLDSKNKDVGYSYPWVRPPLELYHQLAISSSDGIDAMYRLEIGEARNSIKAVFGRNEIERVTSSSTSRNMWGIFDVIEYGPATFNIGYQERESASKNLTTEITGPWVRNSDLSFGASYDPGDWFVISEWMQRKSTYKVGAMYVSAGYRVKKFTPFLTYSQNSPGSFLPGIAAPSPNTIRLAGRTQSTVSMGVRWDFRNNTDLKLQYDQVRPGNDSNGFLVNVPAGVNLSGTRFHVITAVADFVF